MYLRYFWMVLLSMGNMHATFSQSPTLVELEKSPKVLVISGGGARGAWGGGLAQALVKDSLSYYDVVVGSSTGSLLAPLIALEEFDVLREGYTTVRDKDIFNKKPFKTKGPNRGQIKTFNAFWRIIFGRNTLGTSKKLRKTIKRFYAIEDFQRFESGDKEHIATVVNLTKDSIEYKSPNDYSYEEMVTWMWASANAPLFMSLVDVPNQEGIVQTYVDGGVKEGVPLQKGIEMACEREIDEIDVIVHSTMKPRIDDINTGGVIKLLGRVIELFLSENRQNDLVAARIDQDLIQSYQLACEEDIQYVTITYYFMPEEVYEIIPNELLFNQEEMTDMWDAGRNFFQDPSQAGTHMIRIYIPKSQVEKIFQIVDTSGRR